MPFDYGLRLNDRQRIANAREKSIEANKNQSVDGAEGLFLGSGSPQNVYLLPEHPNFRLDRCPRPKQINDHPNNKADKISHPVTASPDSRSTASQIEFATGTGHVSSFERSRPRLECRPAPRLGPFDKIRHLRDVSPWRLAVVRNLVRGSGSEPTAPTRQHRPASVHRNKEKR